MSAQTRSEITDLLGRHGLTPIHRLGQHFLADANITRKIVAAADVGSGDRVVEIGAGTGTLTTELAAAGASVLAYEVDERLRPVLEEVTQGLDVELRFEDASKVDFEKALGGRGWVMAANLPYNVGTPIVLNALRAAPSIARFVVMVQREVADRLTAEVGDDAYGLPSVVVGLFADARLEFKVPAPLFYPPPQVESAVVTLERVDASSHAHRAVELAKAGFGKRRKMLRRSLSGVLDDATATLQSVGIDPMSRAEELSIDDFLRLAEASG